MSDISAPLKLQRKELALPDLMALLKDDIFYSLNCHAIAKIETVDYAKQILTASIVYKKTVYERQNDGTYKPVTKDYPPVHDCPFIILQGGRSRLTFPIKSGDTCLLLFNDRAFDNWFSSGAVQEVSSNLSHSLSDGLALVGLNHLGSVFSNYDDTNVHMKLEDAAKFKLENALYTLGGVMQDFINVLQTLTTTNAVPGSPCALSPATIAQLTTIATKLQGLLA